MECGKKWLVDFNTGKTQLVSFDWSNNTGSIDVKMDGSALEDTSSFKMLVLTFSSKLDWGSYMNYDRTNRTKLRNTKLEKLYSPQKHAAHIIFKEFNPYYSASFSNTLCPECGSEILLYLIPTYTLKINNQWHSKTKLPYPRKP